MAIEFSGRWVRDAQAHDVVFEATVDGSTVRCRVTADALQSIDSSYANSSVELQFVANQEYFQEIARSLIEAGRAGSSELLIGLAEVREWL